MNRKTTKYRLAAVIAVSALALSACGSSDDDKKSGDDNSAAKSTADGTLTFGGLLPQTGSLSFLGPPEFAGVDLAVKDINAAGGVLGKDVVNVKGDSGDTDSGIAPDEADQLIKAKADVIIGAASSGVTRTSTPSRTCTSGPPRRTSSRAPCSRTWS
jgi:ABC-type branched-subunit amino acid transport system substrate-binding protein